MIKGIREQVGGEKQRKGGDRSKAVTIVILSERKEWTLIQCRSLSLL